MYCPARVTKVAGTQDAALLTVVRTTGGESTVRARLVVAADGADSAVRSAFGVAADVRDYGQSALITTILPRKFHEQTAYERFTEEGPLALLPLTDGRCGLVLTLNRELAETAMSWTDDEFLAETQRRFGFRLGRFLKVGRRTAYPLALTRARRTSAARCVIIGNAAQGLHPISGMGFNLGLRDAATLAELAAETAGRDLGEPRTPGGLRCVARSGPAARSSRSPTVSCASSPIPSLPCAACAIWGCWPSICCRRPRPRCRR